MCSENVTKAPREKRTLQSKAIQRLKFKSNIFLKVGYLQKNFLDIQSLSINKHYFHKEI